MPGIIAGLVDELRQLRHELAERDRQLSRSFDQNARISQHLVDLLQRLATAIALPATPPLGPCVPADNTPVGIVRAGASLREIERELFISTLAATGGNRTRAAQMLGVSLRTVRNKIRAYGLPPRRCHAAPGTAG
jgi:DNA-binding NtrC family response regulator